VIQHFNKNGSTVYLSALDATKAFDRVDHNILIKKLVARGAPWCFIWIIKNWYSKLNAVVRWNGVLSHSFSVGRGVRQGGVLSPLMFNVYIDDLIRRLESDRLGCCVNGIYIGCIVYADDILLLSASVASLQAMLNICDVYGCMHNILFNSRKSVCFKIGSKWSSATDCMKLNNEDIKWVSSCKYLGVMFVTGLTLHVDCGYVKRKFYAACNAVLADCKYANEFVKLHLVKSYCLPLLTYCIGSLDLPSYKVKDLGVCWNDTFRKIFGYNRWESVTELQYNCHEIPFEYIYDLCKWNFLHHSKNTGIAAVFIDMHGAIDLLDFKYGNVANTHGARKYAVWQCFERQCDF